LPDGASPPADRCDTETERVAGLDTTGWRRGWHVQCDTGAVEFAPGIDVDRDTLADFCRAHGIRRLGLFGSALRGELRADSDIDLLVEFEPGHTPGMLGIAELELELASLLGRQVDLRTSADLSRHFRDAVVAEARTLYDAA